MKPVILNEKDVLFRMNRESLLSNLLIAFKGLSKNTSVQPSQSITVFPDNRGDCIFYPGLVDDLGVFGVAVSPLFLNLIGTDKHPVKPHTVIFDSSSGELLLIAESLTLTAMRTAGTTAIAVSKFVNKNIKNLAIIGAGQLAIEHAKFAKLIHVWDSIEIVSPSVVDSSSINHSKRMKEINALNGVFPGKTIESTVRKADVVMMCTSASTPVVKQEWLKSVKIITSISTDGENAHEIPPEMLKDLAVYCDSRINTPDIAGEMVLSTEQGMWNKELIVSDLSELVQNKDQIDLKQTVYFRSVGLGIEDIAAAKTLLEVC